MKFFSERLVLAMRSCRLQAKSSRTRGDSEARIRMDFSKEEIFFIPDDQKAGWEKQITGHSSF